MPCDPQRVKFEYIRKVNVGKSTCPTSTRFSKLNLLVQESDSQLLAHSIEVYETGTLSGIQDKTQDAVRPIFISP